MAGFEAKFHGSWQGVAVLKTATADKLKMRHEDIKEPPILKQGSLNFAEKTAMLQNFGKTKLLQKDSHVVPFWKNKTVTNNPEANR